LSQLTHTKASTPLSTNQYGYNTANNIASWLDSSGNRSFSYDSNDRLTSVSATGGNESYGYDGVGNRTSSHLSATYGYQALNKLTSTTSASYTYDNNGNLLSKTDGSGTRTSSWDSENRLKQVTLPGGLIINYKYDALGRRVQRTTSVGVNERFVYDGQDVLFDLDSNLAVTTSYLNGPGMDNHLRQTNTITGMSYFLTDHLGTTSALTDSAGAVVETPNYDSFGNSAGSTRTRYTYTGRERDPDTGLLYYRARFYDPELGRFLSEDPIGLAGGINPFAYVANNPVAYSDPRGLCPQDSANPYREKNKDCGIEVRFSGKLSKQTPGFPTKTNKRTLGKNIGQDAKGNTKFGLRFEVIGSVSEGKIGHIGQGSTSIDLRNGGQWTIGQWIYPFPGSNLDGIPPDGVGATSDDSPRYLGGSSDEATVAVHGRRFTWHDQPGFYDYRNSPPSNFYSLSANFLVYAQNGDKRCEVRFHVWQRYEKGVFTTGVSPGNF
jgi:RHS repeat-associated protein